MSSAIGQGNNFPFASSATGLPAIADSSTVVVTDVISCATHTVANIARAITARRTKLVTRVKTHHQRDEMSTIHF